MTSASAGPSSACVTRSPLRRTPTSLHRWHHRLARRAVVRPPVVPHGHLATAGAGCARFDEPMGERRAGAVQGEPELLFAKGATVEAALIARLVDQSLTERIYGARVVANVRKRLEQARDDLGKAASRMPPGGRSCCAWAVCDCSLRPFRRSDVIRGRSRGRLTGIALLVSPFDGARAEAAKDLERAQAAYDRALQVVPDAQSAMLTVSHLEDGRGNAAVAREWVVNTAGRSPRASSRNTGRGRCLPLRR
jgi:hypothetical protein